MTAPQAASAGRAQMALRYARKTAQREVTLAVPRGSVRHVQLPDQGSKAHLVTAVLKARCEDGEELELLGEPVRSLKPAARERLRARVGWSGKSRHSCACSSPRRSSPSSMRSTRA